jgi:hypothetical protein
VVSDVRSRTRKQVRGRNPLDSQDLGAEVARHESCSASWVRIVSVHVRDLKRGEAMKNWKRAAALLFCAGFSYASRADAVYANWAVEGQVTRVAIIDRALESGGSTEKVLELAFSTVGSDCGTVRAVGETYAISSASSTNSFDEFTKIAQAAYLSGRTLRYSTAKRLSTTPCGAWFMILK